MSSPRTPPRPAASARFLRWLVGWLVAADQADEVTGDLLEDGKHTSGILRTVFWYIRQLALIGFWVSHRAVRNSPSRLARQKDRRAMTRTLAMDMRIALFELYL